MPLIEPGRRAPDFTLPDQHGRPRTLTEHRGMFVVLYFYPEDGTPSCTAQACDFRDANAEFHAANAVILRVSPDTQRSHCEFASEHALPITLLADAPGRGGSPPRTCRAYGAWAEKFMFGRRYMGVVRTTYLIDPAGRVARRWDRVRVSGHAERVLRAVREHSDTLRAAGRAAAPKRRSRA